MVRDALVKIIGVWKKRGIWDDPRPLPVQSFISRFDSDELLYRGIREVVGEVMARRSLIVVKDESKPAKDWNNIIVYSTDEFSHIEFEVIVLAAPYSDSGEGTQH